MEAKNLVVIFLLFLLLDVLSIELRDHTSFGEAPKSRKLPIEHIPSDFDAHQPQFDFVQKPIDPIWGHIRRKHHRIFGIFFHSRLCENNHHFGNGLISRQFRQKLLRAHIFGVAQR